MRRFSSVPVVVAGLCTALAAALAPAPAWPSDVSVDGQIISTASSGAPLAVTSDEKVDNLNADLLDGLDSTELATQVEVTSIYHQAYYTSDGTFTVPAGVTLLTVSVIGGGGGGGGGDTAGGGGGGGSGFVVTTMLQVQPGQVWGVHPGSSGASGSPGANGGDGGPSDIFLTTGFTFVAALGGKGGISAATTGNGGNGFFGGGGGGGSTVSPAMGGSGVIMDGGDKAAGVYPGDGGSGGFGGNSEGGGGGGGGPGGGRGGQTGDLLGLDGSQPGAGGGGGSTEEGGGAAGGAGASGVVLVTWVGAPLGT